MDVPYLIKSGIKTPHKIPGYILGKLAPHSRFGSDWKNIGDVITWDDGFKWGTGTPPEISANDYYSYKAMERMLVDCTPHSALDLGCGYGRLTPWLGEFAESVSGVDPNPAAIDVAREHYPDIDFTTGIGSELPFSNDSFELVMTWTVLHHIPPEEIENTAEEISRIVGSSGWLLLYEAVEGDSNGPTVWTRSETDYSHLFHEFDLVNVQKRTLPWYNDKEKASLLLFKR